MDRRPELLRACYIAGPGAADLHRRHAAAHGSARIAFWLPGIRSGRGTLSDARPRSGSGRPGLVPGVGIRARRLVRGRLHPPRRRPWPVEVNPRYAASVEVLELATGPIAHGRAFAGCGTCTRQGGPTRSGMQTHRSIPQVVGKAILYARSRVSSSPTIPSTRRCGEIRSASPRSPTSRGREPGRSRRARDDRARLGPGHRDLRGPDSRARGAMAAETVWLTPTGNCPRHCSSSLEPF